MVLSFIIPTFGSGSPSKQLAYSDEAKWNDLLSVLFAGVEEMKVLERQVEGCR